MQKHKKNLYGGKDELKYITHNITKNIHNNNAGHILCGLVIDANLLCNFAIYFHIFRPNIFLISKI